METMTALEFAGILRAISQRESVRDLDALALRVASSHPTDKAAATVLRFIAFKIARLVRSNQREPERVAANSLT